MKTKILLAGMCLSLAACESMDSPPWLSISFIVFTYGQPYNIHACLYSAFRI